jgi:hypothetical protein
MLKKMLSLILNSAYVQHKGTVNRQVKGMPMGVNCAPQIANLYCGYYELSYMVRSSLRFLQQPEGHRSRIDRAFLTAMFNGSRFIDDIGLAGIPATIDLTDIFQDRRSEGGSDGIYPISITDSDGTIVANPMELKHEHGGLCTTYLDLRITIGNATSFSTTVYQKRDDMPVFRDYRRFPHIDSLISDKAKYGVFTSQLHRFASICSSSDAFGHNVLRLLAEMLDHGYKYHKLRPRLHRFAEKYKRIQKRVFSRLLCTRTVRHIWSKLLFQCKKLYQSYH